LRGSGGLLRVKEQDAVADIGDGYLLEGEEGGIDGSVRADCDDAVDERK